VRVRATARGHRVDAVSRNPAAQGRKDSNHKAIADALRAIGCPVMDLSHAGNGVEDLLVGVRCCTDWPDVCEVRHWWLVVECKVARNKRGEVTPSQLEPAQKKWRDATALYPRLTVTSAQQAVDEIRRMTK
jgi:hypothetical protein